MLVFVPIMYGMFCIALGSAIVAHLLAARVVGNQLAVGIGFLVFTLAMIGCVLLLDLAMLYPGFAIVFGLMGALLTLLILRRLGLWSPPWLGRSSAPPPSSD
jgi:hypothetical protein